jgi:hypothetical protein
MKKHNTPAAQAACTSLCHYFPVDGLRALAPAPAVVAHLARGLGLLGAAVLLALPASAQKLTNGGTLSVGSGATLSIGIGGLTNAAGASLTNAGTLVVDGPLTNAGTLDLGTAAGVLEVRGDLSNTGIVVPGTGTVAFSGPANQLLTAGRASFYQVVVNKPTAGANTLRLADDLTVTKALTLTNGLVNTQHAGRVHTLRLPNGAALGGEAAGRYVLGALEITRNAVRGGAVDFGHGAVLDPTTNNLGTVAITRVAGLRAADLSYGQNLPSADLQGIDRTWTVAPAMQPSAAVQLTLRWLADDDHGITSFAQARVWEQAAGQPWAGSGPVANPSTRSSTIRPTVLNRFTVGNAGAPLSGALPATGFVVYPTRVPAGQAASYRYTGPVEAGTLEILNMMGQTVRRVTLDGRSAGAVPLAGLATGAYSLRYTGPAGRFTTRCVVE